MLLLWYYVHNPNEQQRPMPRLFLLPQCGFWQGFSCSISFGRIMSTGRYWNMIDPVSSEKAASMRWDAVMMLMVVFAIASAHLAKTHLRRINGCDGGYAK
jgi:hypothetical protein